VHVDLHFRRLLDAGAAASSTSRRLSALSSFYVERTFDTPEFRGMTFRFTAAGLPAGGSPSGPARS
jgi:hypothetical protein